MSAATREWKQIQQTAQFDRSLAKLLKARDLCFKAGHPMTAKLTSAARQYFRKVRLGLN